MTHLTSSHSLKVPAGAISLGLSALFAATANGADTIRQYQLAAGSSGYELQLKEVPQPTAQRDQVLVRVRAVSLNRRDLSMLRGQYGRGGDSANGVPLSDGAGEVIAVGADVTRFKVGDRVAGIFFERSRARATGNSPGMITTALLFASE